MSFAAGTDLCLGFFSKLWDGGLLEFPPNATVLEIGCAEADWQRPMLALRPDLRITGIDVRGCDRPGTLVQADVLTHDFPAASFDAIVSVSAMEHIGLGAYGDPIDADGDTRAMCRAASWLKPGGWFYLDVPYRKGAYELHHKFRAYNDEQMLKRLIQPSGLRLKVGKTFTPDHPDGPYLAVILEKAV